MLENLDVTIRRGDFTVIMGPSGAGKSTLLYALSGLDRPTAGEIQLAGQSLAGLTESELARFRRRHCGFVFQQIHLVGTLSARDNVMAAGLLVTRDRHRLARRVDDLFDRVRLPRELGTKFPAQLSGGEAQRVGVVRALVNSPSVVFADEPTGALDQASGSAVLDILSDVHRAGQSIVLVTHDLKSAHRGNRVVYLRDGAVVGDLGLPPFAPGDARRSALLRRFLVEMGW